MPGYRWMMCNNTWCFYESFQVTDSDCRKNILQAINVMLAVIPVLQGVMLKWEDLFFRRKRDNKN